MTETAPTWAIKETISGDIEPGLGSFAGRPLVLVFFNLTCAGCTGRALPHTLELRERYPGLQFAAIHSSFSENSTFTKEQVKQALDLLNIDYPVFMDDGEETFIRYEAEGTPHWIIFDKEGNIHRSLFGSMAGAIQRLEYIFMEMFG